MDSLALMKSRMDALDGFFAGNCEEYEYSNNLSRRMERELAEWSSNMYQLVFNGSLEVSFSDSVKEDLTYTISYKRRVIDMDSCSVC